MPLAEQKLKEKLHFDVYAMMNILGFLALCGAIWFIHDHLIVHWYGGEGGTDENGQPLTKPKAENLTKINRLHEAIYLQETDELVKLGYDPTKAEKELSVEVQVTDRDKEDYKRIADGSEIPGLVPWPAEIDPLKSSVKVDPGFDNTQGREPYAQKLAESYQDVLKDEDTSASAAGTAPPAAPAAGTTPPPLAPATGTTPPAGAGTTPPPPPTADAPKGADGGTPPPAPQP